MLELDAVDPDRRNIRRGTIDDAEVETLRVALRAALQRGEEFDHPITVYPSGAGRHTIKHGHRRYAAARLEGVERLHFHVVAPPSERDRILDQLDDNLNARSLSPLDLARAFEDLRSMDRLSIGQLVEVLRARGVPGVERGAAAAKVWVRQHLDLLKLHPDVQDLVEKGQLGYSVAVKLKDQPRPQQAAFARTIVAEGLSSREVDVALDRQPTIGYPPSAETIELAPRAGGGTSAESVESRLASLRQQLAEGAEAPSSPGLRPAGRYDAERQPSPVRTRAEFLGTSASPAPVDDRARRRLETLNASEWAVDASAGVLTIARDLVNWGRRSSSEAIRLAEQCMAALADSPDAYVRLMHVARLTLEQAGEPLSEPLRTVLKLWIEQMPSQPRSNP